LCPNESNEKPDCSFIVTMRRDGCGGWPGRMELVTGIEAEQPAGARIVLIAKS
jgi:hypothetical protein